MGQTHSAPPQDALRFRHMARATYDGDLDTLRHYFHPSLVALQVSRATYLDICMHEQIQIDTITDSLERETKSNALQDEKMEFFSAVEKGKIVLGDTILHIAVRRGHDAIVDFLLLTDHVPRPLTGAARATTPATPATPATRRAVGGTTTSRSSSPSAAPTSTGSGLNSTQTPNFKGDFPRDVAATPMLRLVLDNVADVHAVFGVAYSDEPKVHRLVQSLRRVWPLWMLEGAQEAAGLVRVLCDARSSDAAFGNLVKVALASAERFRCAVSRDGIRVAAKLLVDSGGQLHTARETLLSCWTHDHKRQLLFAIFRNYFRTWRHRHHNDQDAAFVEFFDAAMAAWLAIAHDLQLHEQLHTSSSKQEIEIDVATLRRYDLQVWARRLRPPPSVVDDLCMHITALERYLDLAHLKA